MSGVEFGRDYVERLKRSFLWFVGDDSLRYHVEEFTRELEGGVFDLELCRLAQELCRAVVYTLDSVLSDFTQQLRDQYPVARGVVVITLSRIKDRKLHSGSAYAAAIKPHTVLSRSGGPGLHVLINIITETIAWLIMELSNLTEKTDMAKRALIVLRNLIDDIITDEVRKFEVI